MSEKVPLPGTGMELDTNDGLTGNVSTIAKGGIGFAVVFVMLALGAFLFRQGRERTGQNSDVNIPVV
jgi:hypothetical protein